MLVASDLNGTLTTGSPILAVARWVKPENPCCTVQTGVNYSSNIVIYKKTWRINERYDQTNYAGHHVGSRVL